MKTHGHDSYRIVVDYDPDPDFSYLEQECFRDEKTGRLPDQSEYVALCMSLEGACECCGHWETLDSLGNIDFLESADDWQTGTFPVPLPASLKGYLRDCADEMIRQHVKAAG